MIAAKAKLLFIFIFAFAVAVQKCHSKITNELSTSVGDSCEDSSEDKNDDGPKNCTDGQYGFPDCKECDCNPDWTVPELCDKANGRCLCREGFGGSKCEACATGFFGHPECVPCNCSKEGSLREKCAPDGPCPCKPNYTGRACDQCANGYENYPKCNPKCEQSPIPNDLVVFPPGGKYVVRRDFGPVPNDASLNLKAPKEYCESRGLTLPTIDHHGDWVTLQKLLLEIYKRNPGRMVTRPGDYQATERMVYTAYRWNENQKTWTNEHEKLRSMYVSWDYDLSLQWQPDYTQWNATRIMVDVVQYGQRWRNDYATNPETPEESSRRFWMAAIGGNEIQRMAKPAILVCQLKTTRANSKDKSSSSKNSDCDEDVETPDLDYLGVINGTLFAVVFNPVAKNESIKICEDNGMQLFELEMPTFSAFKLYHDLLSDYSTLNKFRDFYVCRNLKRNIQPLAPFWGIYYYNTKRPIRISIWEYSKELDTDRKFWYEMHPGFAVDPNAMPGMYTICYCRGQRCMKDAPSRDICHRDL